MTTFLGQLSEGRSNNFDFLRFFFASLVIFSHSYAILYGGTLHGYDPLVRLTSQIGFGGGAVDGFFLISGFLITASWLHCKGLLDYTMRRVLRIAPALVVVLLFCVFVIGPLATTQRSTYFHDPATYRYFLMMLTKNLHITDRLPGVFPHNPDGPRVDGSLWTIRVEVICYILVAVFGLVRCYSKPAVVVTLAVLTAIVRVINSLHPSLLGQFEGSSRLVLFFLIGMIFYLYRDRIPYSQRLFWLAVVLLVVTTMFHCLRYVLPLLSAYVVFFIAYCPRLRLQNFARRGDLSYGIYLYAAPIQQLLTEYYRPHLNAYSLTAAGFALTYLCALASWHFVEAPFMRLKRRSQDVATVKVAG